MRLKPGVSVRDIDTELLLALDVMDSVYRTVAGTEMMVTSVKDGQHSVKSKHWLGSAADLRTTAAGIEAQTVEQIAAEGRAQLGKDFDVIVEFDHIHLEYDPKGRN